MSTTAKPNEPVQAPKSWKDYKTPDEDVDGRVDGEEAEVEVDDEEGPTGDAVVYDSDSGHETD